jgi:hypothetical protein
MTPKEKKSLKVSKLETPLSKNKLGILNLKEKKTSV